MILLLLVVSILTGCHKEEGDEYLSLRPHVEQPGEVPLQTQEEVLPVAGNRLELRGAILSMIDNWEERGKVLIQDYVGDVEQNLSEIMDYATRQHPTGAYAVDYAHGELLEEKGQQYVQVSIVFRRSPAEINSIVLVDDNDAARLKIQEALDSLSPALTLRIRRYSEEDFPSFVETYCLENPRKMPAIPGYSVKLYPEEGDHRIMELHFSYPESRESMRTKLQEIQIIFSSF